MTVLTGAGGGLGRAFAERLAREGARLCITDIAGDPLQATAQACTDLGAEVTSIVADLVEPHACADVVDAATAKWGRVDALVNNAAAFAAVEPRPFELIAAQEIDHLLAVNVRAPLMMCQAVSPQMRRNRRGKIVNVVSASILSGAYGLAHYVASKGALFALTRALARELGTDGITVNSLAPGLTITDAAQGTHARAVFETARESRAIKRDEVAEDVVGSLVYLLSSDSDFVTGQMLVVNGGAQFW